MGELIGIGIILMIPISVLVFSIYMIILTSNTQIKKRKNAITNMNNEFSKNKYVKSNNCNRCPKQNTCKYGYYTYDTIEQRQLALWEKFMLLGSTLNNTLDFKNRPDEINLYVNKYSAKTKFSVEDIDWLNKYLDYEQKQLNKVTELGKCGKAYAKYMKLDSLVNEIKLKLKMINNTKDKAV